MPITIVHSGPAELGLAGAAGRAQGKAIAAQRTADSFTNAFQQGISFGARAYENKTQRDLEEKIRSESYQRQKELSAINAEADRLRQQDQQDFQRQENELNRANRVEIENIQQRSQNYREGVQQFGRSASAAGQTIRGVAETVRKGINDYGDRQIAQQRADTYSKSVEIQAEREKNRASEAASRDAERKRKEDEQRNRDAKKVQTQAMLEQSLLRRFGVDAEDSLPIEGRAALGEIRATGRLSPTMLKALEEDSTGSVPIGMRSQDSGFMRTLAAYDPKGVASLASQTGQDGNITPQAIKAQQAILASTYDPNVSYEQLKNNMEHLTNAPQPLVEAYSARVEEIRKRRMQTIFPKFQAELNASLAADYGSSSLARSLDPAEFSRRRGALMRKYNISPSEYEDYTRDMEARANQLLQNSLMNQGTNNGNGTR